MTGLRVPHVGKLARFCKCHEKSTFFETLMKINYTIRFKWLNDHCYLFYFIFEKIDHCYLFYFNYALPRIRCNFFSSLSLPNYTRVISTFYSVSKKKKISTFYNLLETLFIPILLFIYLKSICENITSILDFLINGTTNKSTMLITVDSLKFNRWTIFS